MNAENLENLPIRPTCMTPVMDSNSQPVGKMSSIFDIHHRFLYALTAGLKGKKMSRLFFSHCISAGGEFGSITRVIGGIEKFCIEVRYSSSFSAVLIARLQRKIRRHIIYLFFFILFFYYYLFLLAGNFLSIARVIGGIEKFSFR